ncbi:MAG TPA: type II secretion system protein [Candidatus Dormibacteraeota bacterium]|jgi:prepilin-type N-terminal cleavage/methylation domain-containing protein|nr:type II secretion system protein [Candidatus Dormibacteraeota bacterium]
MRSSRARGTRSLRLSDQRGLGLVEVLVASAILGVSLVVMLTNMSTMVVGARVADRRTGEERLVRNQIETLMAAAPTCNPSPAPPSASIDGTKYTVEIQVTATDPTGKVVACTTAHYLEYNVTATDPSGARVALSVGRYRP